MLNGKISLAISSLLLAKVDLEKVLASFGAIYFSEPDFLSVTPRDSLTSDTSAAEDSAGAGVSSRIRIG